MSLRRRDLGFRGFKVYQGPEPQEVVVSCREGEVTDYTMK